MPDLTGATVVGAAAVGGNPAPGQRGKFIERPRFKIRVLDPVSGAVVIDTLPHPNVVEYEDILPQSGMAGSSAIASCTILLYHPLTDEYAWAKTWYDKLAQMQRIELYMVEDDDAGIVGDPCFTGVIMNLPKSEMDFRIEAKDSLVLLEMSRTLQADTFNNTTDQLVRYALKTYQMTTGDDWTADLSAYTNNGSWAITADEGFPAITAGFAGDGLLYTTASYTNDKYADCFIEAPFRLTCGTNPNVSTAESGLIAAVADTSNFVLGRAFMRCIAANQYYIDAEIWLKSGGVYTRKAVTQNVVSETTNVARVTVTLIGVQTAFYGYTWRVLLNEIDSNCSWVQGVSLGSPTGSIGARASAALGSIIQHHLIFFSKTNAFQPGNIVNGGRRINQPIPSQQNIDLLMLAMSTEGGVWRKNPKAGLNNDQVDFAASVGGDLVGLVRMEADVGALVSYQTEQNAEGAKPHTMILAAGSDAYNTRGLQKWPDIPTIKNSGVVIGTAHVSQTVDLSALRQVAQNVLLKRKQPTQAGRMTVARIEAHAELPNQPKPTGMAYRAGDWVQVHNPKQGVNYARKQLMSVKVRSGHPLMECTTDQYPVVLDNAPLVDRMLRTLDTMAIGSAEVTTKDPATGVIHDLRTALPINPWKMRVYQAGAQNVSKDVVTKILLDTVTTDTSNGFSATNSTYTVQATGYYVIDAAVSFAQPNEANQWQYWIAFIYVNGVLAKQGTTTEFLEPGIAVSVAQCSATVADSCYFLNSADVVDIRFVVHCAAATVAIATGTAYTAWSMHLVSG